MNVEQILSLGPELADFLDEFANCFGRSEPRCHMAEYVQGQLSELPRKSVEPIALAAGIAPRTLQEFLRTDVWDHSRMRDRVQQIIVRDHDAPQRIGIIDDSGHPKKGRQTACVNRQYCGRSGKIDNCVISVHLTASSFDTAFRTMADSTPYLPKSWHEDRQRCEKAGIPDDVVYRPKYDIALEQLDDRNAQRAEVRLDHGRHLVLGEAAISRWTAGTRPTVCAGDPAKSGVLVVRSGHGFVAAGGAPSGPGGEFVPAFASCPQSAVGPFPHQRHRERADGLGGADDSGLAQMRGKSAWPAAARPTRSAKAGVAFPATRPNDSSRGETDGDWSAMDAGFTGPIWTRTSASQTFLPASRRVKVKRRSSAGSITRANQQTGN